MYYVIKRQKDVPLNFFVGFKVPKYIASKKNDSVIFEFEKDGKPQRKWIRKEDLILLTEDRDYFLKIFNQFKESQAIQQKLVSDAREKLEESMENFTKAMEKEINEYNEIKNSEDVPNILKDI